MYPPLFFTSKEKVPVGKTADDELRAYQGMLHQSPLRCEFNKLRHYSSTMRGALRQEEHAMSSQDDIYNLSMTISQVNFGYRLLLT